MFAVVVQFKIVPGQMQAFLPLMHENARSSLAQEPGCQRFDILTDPKYPETVALYEIYDDAEAFAAHLASDHFKRFDAATGAMLAEKQVTTWSEVVS